ncbi:mitochondrial import inner membrane translocase-like protein subunit tim16 [Wilcoxina mikolae CBS 423.85]|nr:mitochondrial import inner membrane translocase-like protein subunit tim16 [Wilcoxina mikolae CBS 423.85]
MAHRIVAQIVLVGSRVLGRAFVEAYRQAQASAKYAKAAQAGTVSGGTTINVRGGLTLDEAYKILNVKPSTEAGGLSPESVAERYKTLFERNDPKKGGSFYLQSKIYRARERLDQEIKRAAEKAKTAEP